MSALDKDTLKAAGERLQKILVESYDQQTFNADFLEFVELALKGELLPEIVIEKVGDVFINPIFHPEYAAPHPYRHSIGYPEDSHVCVCGQAEEHEIHNVVP